MSLFNMFSKKDPNQEKLEKINKLEESVIYLEETFASAIQSMANHQSLVKAKKESEDTQEQIEFLKRAACDAVTVVMIVEFVEHMHSYLSKKGTKEMLKEIKEFVESLKDLEE